MLNFGASKPRVKGGPGPPGPPLDLHLHQQTVAISAISNSFEILIMFATIHSFSRMNE